MQQPEVESLSNRVYEVGLPENAKQMLELGRIISQCFNADLNNWQAYVQRLGPANFRVIREQGRIVGGLGLYPMGQWYGGQAVPMTGIAAVGTTPDYRGQGAAVTLLRHTLQDLYEQGLPLASLYASTSHLYRRVGFEQAGSFCRYSLPINQVSLCSGQEVVRDHHLLPLTPIQNPEPALLIDLYRQQAQSSNGNLERNDAIWSSILDDKDQPIYAYLLGTHSAPEGYVILTQRSGQTTYSLIVRDLVLLTAAAAHRFVKLVADHRSLADRLFWYGSPVDPLLSLLEEQIYRVEHLERWLLRVVNVPRALELRGYPTGVEAELHLEVVDDLLPSNAGFFTLGVSGGKGQVIRGGRGDLKMDIRGLASLYSGLMTALQLQKMGWLSGRGEALA
ncbi:MAG: GNAT family N-acetyltransferase, partial [Cyanobacteria bacterium P01_A01_bin.17]